MASRHTVADGAWSSVATWDGTTTVPTVGDDVTILNNVTLDVVLPLFDSITITSGGLTASNSTDYLSAQPTVYLATGTVSLTGITTVASINISDAASATCTAFHLHGNANNPLMTIADTSNLTWSGSYDSDGSNMSLASGHLIGNGLTFTNCNEFDVNGGTISGNITFLSPGAVPSDSSGGGSPPTFTPSTWTFRTGQAVDISYAATIVGTINTYDALTLADIKGGSVTVDLKAQKRVSVGNGNTIVNYQGPASGANANMRIGL